MQSRQSATDTKIVNIDFAKTGAEVPPQAIEAEEAVLGGILLDPEAMSRVVDLLSPEAFYVGAHRELYKAVLSLYNQGQPTDFMLVAKWLHDNKLLDGIGGQNKIARLIESTVSAVNIDRYAALVMDKHQRRQLIAAGNNIVRLGHELATGLDVVLNNAEQEIFAITQDKNTTQIEPPAKIMLRVYENAIAPKTQGLLSGIYDLDALTGGFKPKKLYVAAGRSGMGKTQFAVALAAQALKKSEPVVFFSAEMDRDELMCRILAWESGLDSKKIEEGSLASESEFTQLSESVNILSGCPLYLDDTPGSSLTPIRIRSGIRRAIAIYGQPKLVILDYLQLLGDESSKTNRVSELDKIANGCKAIAKEFNVPFVALAQINRSVESRNDKRPLISDLRESGAIEQSADVILMLYREDYYNIDTPEQGICEVIVNKHRGGATGMVKTLFDPKTSRFNSIAQSREERLSHDNHVSQFDDFDEEF